MIDLVSFLLGMATMIVLPWVAVGIVALIGRLLPEFSFQNEKVDKIEPRDLYMRDTFYVEPIRKGEAFDLVRRYESVDDLLESL